MWLATKYGFFSVVEVPGILPEMAVRARSHEHLCMLKEACRPAADAVIIHTEDTDYPYRIIINRDTWLQLALALACGIDYGNFKAEAKENLPHDTAYHGFLYEVWQRGQHLEAPAAKAAPRPQCRKKPQK